MFRQRQTMRVDAVLEEDLDTLLERLGITDKFNAGGFNCQVCERPITPRNLKLIIPSGNTIRFLCDKPSCIVAFAFPGALDQTDQCAE